MTWSLDQGKDAGRNPFATGGQPTNADDITNLQPRAAVGPMTPTNIPIDRIKVEEFYATQTMAIIVKNGGAFPKDTPMALMFTNRSGGNIEKSTWSKGPYMRWTNFLKQDDKFTMPVFDCYSYNF